MSQEFIPLYYDQLFIDIFGNKKNIRFSEYLLECLFELDEGSLRNKLTVGFEITLPRESNDKTSRCDLIYELGNTLINLECYSRFNESSLNKSLKYFTKLDNEVLLRKEKKFERMIQINLIKKVDMKLAKVFINEQIIKPSGNLIRMCIVRLDQVENVKYNCGNKRMEDLKAFCKYLGAENQSLRKEIAKEREILMDLENTVNEYLEGTNLKREDFLYEKNTRESYYDVGFRNGEKRGEKRGEKKGKRLGLIETAKNLLNYGMSIEDISRNTNLSKKEIESLR